jgi:hypothetical protein
VTRKKATELVAAILAERAMPAYPDAAAKAGVGYTDYLTGAGAKAKGVKFSSDPQSGDEYVYTPHRNRQCAIGYHAECTDPEGETCGCPCHPLIALLAGG